MSTNYKARIIYGFPAEVVVARDRRSGTPTYLGEWLTENVPGFDDGNDIMAGATNGGSPDHFVGVVLAEVDDFTRSIQPWMSLNVATPSDEQREAVQLAFEKLCALDPGLVHAAPGLYLMGEGA